jgi:hypothetical protein
MLPGMLLLPVLACKSVGFDLDVDLFPTVTTPVEVPAASPFELALFDERPTATLPAFLDLEAFGPVLVADRVRRAEGDGFVSVSVSDVSFSVDAPLTLTFDVQSLDGRWHVLGGESGEVAPSCTFEVTADRTADEQAAALLACLRDTADRRGGPNDFHVEVSATTTDDDWEYRAVYTLGTERPAEVACTGPLAISDELKEQAGSTELVVEDLSLAGYAAALDVPASVVAFAGTWVDDASPAVAGASGSVRVEAGEGRFVGEEVEVGEDVPASVTFGGPIGAVEVWPGDWATLAMDTLLADGFLETCDVRVHDAAPNRTFVELALVGTGEAIRQ